MLGGINYAIGDNSIDYGKAKTQRQPEANRFSKQIIINDLNEPMALAIAKDGRVFFCERKGKVFMHDPKKGTTKPIAQIEVDEFAGMGLMGLTLDPEFLSNKLIYLFYTDPKDIYTLSKFKVKDDVIDKSSGQVIFSFPFDHEPGAHNGGTILFDSKGNLIISIGDNTPPWQANGFPPYDQRPGREIYDAQRSASNTQDFRGKILRIKPNPHGPGYTVPNGNLFSKDGKTGKPEIYVMGCRNPWRMNIDLKTDNIYWGEVGPDAGKDSTIGPRGYDEINQAKKPGNFGWPYFVADNKPYAMVDLVNPTPGPLANVEKPVNNSKNNTGQKELLPPTKAFIWYPYGDSWEFPEVGKGGRTACAGPFYTYNDHKGSNVKFPKYYDGKMLIYDWIRDWLRAVTIDKDGNYVKMEPVLQNLKFAHPTHMAFGPDGALYVLEYGYIWYSQNDNAQLSRIVFSEGNRPPVAKIVSNDTIGQMPLKVKFNAGKSFDYDNDKITYEWSFEGKKIDSEDVEAEYTYTKPGIYNATLTVKDNKGASSITETRIIVGNTYPVVNVNVTDGNKSFFWENEDLNYKVDVTDKEDKFIVQKKIKARWVFIPNGKDIYPLSNSHSEAPKERSITENTAIAASDCKACHAFSKKSVGPAFTEVAKKYADDPKAVDYLSEKIIKGGSGVWGDHAMSAHPQLSKEVTKEMVKYIIGLAHENEGRYTKDLEPQGIISASEFKKGKKGWFYLTASYDDNGSNGMGSLISYGTITLKNAKVEALDADTTKSITPINSTAEGFSNQYAGGIAHKSHLYFDHVDLTNIGTVTLRTNSKEMNGKVELRIDKLDGPIIATFPIKAAGAWEKWSELNQNINSTGFHKLFFVVLDDNPEKFGQMNIDWIIFGKAKSKLADK